MGKIPAPVVGNLGMIGKLGVGSAEEHPGLGVDGRLIGGGGGMEEEEGWRRRNGEDTELDERSGDKEQGNAALR